MKTQRGMCTAEYGSLLDVLHAQASALPERRVFSFRTHAGDDVEDVHITSGALERGAHALGARLSELGLEGERALLLYPPGLEFITAFFGCLSAGVVAVPTPLPRPNRPMERLRAILNDAGPRVVVTTAVLAADQARWVTHAPELADLPWVASDAIADELAGRWRDPGVRGDTLAFLQYTSGSTDEPKGVMVSHGNLLHNLAVIGQSFGATEASRGVFWLPLHHDMGLIGGVLQTLYCGGSSLLFSPVAFLQKPLRWLEAISQTRATISGGPNFGYELCARKITEEEHSGLDLSQWAVAFNGAETVRAETLDRFVEVFGSCGFRREAFLPCYGLAEATLMVSSRSEVVVPKVLEVDADGLEENRVSPVRESGRRPRVFVGCGRAAAGQEVVIVDPQTNARCPENGVGEIWVAGPSVAQGYWNRPEQTLATFDAALDGSSLGRFLRTGDLGFMRDGELFVTGRIKDVIIIRGRNIYPQDLEATVARSHPLLRADGAAAFSVDCDGEEHLVIASEVERKAKSEQTDEIAAAIRQAIAAEHEIEVGAVLLLKAASIPKTTSGKIRRRACREAYLEGTLDLVGASDRINAFHARRTVVAPSGPGSCQIARSAPARSASEIQAWLAGRVAAMLGISESAIEPDRPLSQLGLGSLRTIGMAGELQEWLGRPLDATFFCRDATVAELAAELATRADAMGVVPEAAIQGRCDQKPMLSHGQKSLWSLYQLNPGSAAYHIAAAVRIHGAVDVYALRTAFQTLVDRHAALRSIFPSVDGQPILRIPPAVGVDFRVEDVSDIGEAEVSRRLIAEARRPFELEQGPVFRVRLFTATYRDPILLMAMHHIISDFWSIGILVNELGRIYPAVRYGTRIDLASPSREAADYAQWQAARVGGGHGERLWAYWRSKLAGPLPVLDFPTDRPRPPVQTDHGARRSLQLDSSLSQRLAALAADHGSSLFVTLLAAFKVLLYRYTGQEDLIVGAPVAGRNQADFGGVVGYLVNTLPLRSNLAGNPPFATLLKQVRSTVLEGLEHQDYPFALLVDRLGVPRDPSRTPLFQAMFVFQQAQVLAAQGLTAFALREGGARMNLGDLPIESIALDLGTAQFDLTLVAAEAEDHLALTLEFNTDLFDATTIDRLFGHFQTLLESIVAAPEQPIAALPLLPSSERDLLVASWATHPADPPATDLVTQLFELQASRNPDVPAVVCGDQTLTYAALDQRSSALAQRLRKRGVGPEARVGLCVTQSIEMIVGILGILKAGGAYVPLDPDLPPKRLEFLLADAEIELVLTQVHRQDRFPGRDHRVVLLDAPDGQDTNGHASSWPVQNEATALLSGENLAYVIYTSGSTGAPKGVMVTHRNLAYSTDARLQYYREPMSAFLLLSPVIFDSSVAGIFGTLCRGATLVIPPVGGERDPEMLVQLINEHKVSHLLCIPSLYQVLLDELAARGHGSLRVAIVAGEPCRPALARRHYAALPDTALVNEYGPTEATVWCSAHRCMPRESGAIIPIGRPIPHARLYVLDAGGQPTPVDVVGELHVGGPCVARGYLNRPELTAERFSVDPFHDAAGSRLYRTGDLARWLSDGVLEFRGRIDDQVKVRGRRIELGEVESVLLRHPEVRDAVVVAREDVPGAVRLVAYLVANLDAGHFPGNIEWRRWTRSRLPDSMVPSAFVVVDRLPRLPNGKVDRKALPAPEPCPAVPGGRSVAPRNRTEEVLAGIVSDVLGRERVGVNEDLIDLGLDSILGIQIATRAREAGLALGPAELFQHTTIADLAEHALTVADEPAERPAAVNGEPKTRRELAAAIKADAQSSTFEATRRRGPRQRPDSPVLSSRANGIARSARLARRESPVPATGRSARPKGPASPASGMSIRPDRPALPTKVSLVPTVIESFGVYLPPKVVSTAEIIGGCRLPLDFPLERMTGIRNRRMAGETEFAIDLAEKAVIDCFARSARKPGDIDLLICCNISRCDGPGMQFTYEPATAARLQRRLGLEHAVAFDISNACAGTFTAIAIADAFLKTGAASRALVVSGEYITHLTQTAQKEISGFLDPRVACLTLGDSGVAILLERAQTKGIGFQELELYTLGKYSNLCVAKATDRSHGGAIMLTDSIEGAAVSIQQVVGHSLRCLARAGWQADSLDQIIMHQTSETTLDGAVGQINRSLGRTVCDRRNTIYDLAERGNTATNSHFIALRDAIDAGLVKPGSRVLFGVSGSGQTVGTALYTFDDLPERIRRSNSNQVAPALDLSSSQRRERARGAGGGAAESPDRARYRGAGAGAAESPDRAQYRNTGEGPRAEAPHPREARIDGRISLPSDFSPRRRASVTPRVRIESVGTIGCGDAVRRDSWELVRQAAERCLSASRHQREDIGLVIHSGVYRNDFLSEPAVAAIAAGALKINDDGDPTAASGRRTLAFDVMNSGVGSLNACHVAAQMIRAGKANSALVVAAEIENNAGLGAEHHVGLVEMGSALLLEVTNREEGFGQFVFRCLSEYGDDVAAHTVARNGAAALHYERSPDYERHLIKGIAAAVDQLLSLEGLSKGAVAKVFPPHRSRSFVMDLAEALGLPLDRFVLLPCASLDYSTSSLAVALEAASAAGEIAPGDIGLLIAAGAGVQIGCATYRFGNKALF
jgi:amino acid adenylation domain-containing protein